MQINNLTDASRYNHTNSFSGSIKPRSKKVRYKHYEEMSNEALGAYSILKAHQTVRNGKKTKLLKSIPAIAQTIIISSLSLTHPGKLATKAGVGLGLLVTLLGFDKVTEFSDKLLDKAIDKKEEKTNKKIDSNNRDVIKTIASVGTAIVGIPLLVLAANKGIKALQAPKNKITRFIASEKNQLVNELNSTKLASLMDNKINPFIKKHEKAFHRANFILPLASVIGATFAENKLLNSISKDISKKAAQNFAKGKMIQQMVRNHFDSVDAKEV